MPEPASRHASSRPGPRRGGVRPRSAALADLVDLVLPRTCAGCGRPGTAWCARCARRLEALRHAPGPVRTAPDPCPRGYPPTWAWGRYAQPLRAVVTAWKDEGRRDLDPVLAPLLALAVRAAVAASGWDHVPVLVVPVPSSSAGSGRRGEVPLARMAGRIGGPWADRAHRRVPALVALRGIADQAGLGARDRAANVAGRVAVPDAWGPVVAGRHCLLVDDVTTSGATLAECARALAEAGAAGISGAVVAATERRGKGSGRHPM